MKITNIYARGENHGAGRNTAQIRYIAIHYTANRNDTAAANGNYFKNNIVKASAHYFVDENGIVCSVPDDVIAYAVGGKRYSTPGGKLYGQATNANTLNIELCGGSDGKATEKTIENALVLVREKRKNYNIPIENVIRHYDVNGKPCPAYWTDDALWEKEFHGKIREITYQPGNYKTTQDAYLRSKPAAVKAYTIEYGNLSIALRLKCRKDENGYAVFCKGKAFTLTEETADSKGNLWGKMKSGYYVPLRYNGKERISK